MNSVGVTSFTNIKHNISIIANQILLNVSSIPSQTI